MGRLVTLARETEGGKKGVREEERKISLFNWEKINQGCLYVPRLRKETGNKRH